MNYYGEIARKHWEKYRPVEYAAMRDREEFFEQLGEQISDQIAELAPHMEGQAQPGETFLSKIGRLNMAKLMAQEQVLRETLPPTEEDDPALP
jgi:hypothetical protein